MLNTGKLLRPELTIVVFLVLSFVSGVLLSPNFLDIRFLLSSTIYYTELGLIALCFALLMTSGELDLSVAANMTLVTCILGVLHKMGVSMVFLVPLGLVFGTCLGLVNGVLVTVTGLPSLIITIGTLSIYRGLAQVLVGDAAISGFPQWFLRFGKITVFGIIPLPLIIIVVVAVILEILLKRNFWGRKISAVGLNSNAAKYSGVKVDSMKRQLFALQGFFCGTAALLSISRLEVVKYSIGTGGEMDVVTMVLLGGTAFTGGKGACLGTLAAFFIIVFIRTGMRLATISSYVQIAVLGVLLIVIIVISNKLNALFERNS
ncbi:ABC transporter permease [Treponema sp. TIM-1]|uniref:ABC transporter permease n=1 Tax=Treponema sp. TIM-1 TaxID=2898417 RepID=UPI00397F69D9